MSEIFWLKSRKTHCSKNVCWGVTKYSFFVTESGTVGLRIKPWVILSKVQCYQRSTPTSAIVFWSTHGKNFREALKGFIDESLLFAAPSWPTLHVSTNVNMQQTTRSAGSRLADVRAWLYLITKRSFKRTVHLFLLSLGPIQHKTSSGSSASSMALLGVRMGRRSEFRQKSSRIRDFFSRRTQPREVVKDTELHRERGRSAFFVGVRATEIVQRMRAGRLPEDKKDTSNARASNSDRWPALSSAIIGLLKAAAKVCLFQISESCRKARVATFCYYPERGQSIQQLS